MKYKYLALNSTVSAYVCVNKSGVLFLGSEFYHKGTSFCAQYRKVNTNDNTAISISSLSIPTYHLKMLVISSEASFP
jgi:hypothetical protein